MDEQKELLLLLKENLELVVKTNKDLQRNQCDIIKLLKQSDERQTLLQNRIEMLEKAFQGGSVSVKGSLDKPADPKITSIANHAVEVTKQASLSDQIEIMENRMTEVESKLKHVDGRLLYQETLGDQSFAFTKDKRSFTDGINPADPLDRMEAMSMGCWSTSSEHDGTGYQQDKHEGKGFKGKGSFKAACHAIVFVNRLTVLDAATAMDVQEEEAANSGERTGGDHLKAAAHAIVFMVRLLKALQLPLVLDRGMEITPD